MKILDATMVVLCVLFLIVCLCFGQGAKPKLTDAQKLEIRNAQVTLLQAQQTLQATPQWAAYQQAQTKLNDLAAKVYKEAGVDSTKFTLNQELEFVPVEAPKAEKK